MPITVPTSIRLRPLELDLLRDAAGFSGVSLSDVARRAIVAYLGIDAHDIRREDHAATVVELGRLRQDLARLGNLCKLALDSGRPVSDDLQHDLRAALANLKTAIAVLTGMTPP